MQVSYHTEHEGDQEVVVFRLRLSEGEGGSATAKVVILMLSLNVRLQDNRENAIMINVRKMSSNLLLDVDKNIIRYMYRYRASHKILIHELWISDYV